MSKHKAESDAPAVEEPTPPTAFEQAMCEITAEAKKLVEGGMGSHDAYELAYNVWLHTIQMG